MQGKSNDRGLLLTPREQEVLSLIREGKTNKQVGEQLNIRLPTVEAHIKNIFRKAGVSRRTQLLTWQEK